MALFKTKRKLSNEEVDSGLRYLIKDGVATQIKVTLTSGAFLIAFALGLGANNLIIGLLAAIGPLAQLLQLPYVMLVEKVKNRRLLVVVSATIMRLCWVFIILIPFFFFGRIALIILLGSLIFASCFNALAACSWNSWMSDLVPKSIMGEFFSRRMRVSVGFGIIISLLASFFIDYWEKSFPAYGLYGYSILFSIGLTAGLIGIYFITKIPEPRMVLNRKKNGLFKIMSKPFKDENFKNLIAFLGSWNFAVNLAAPFFIVYMIKRLGYSIPFVIALTVLSQVMNFLFLEVWGRFSDRFSNKSVLVINGPLFIFSILAWTFTTLPDKHLFTTPLIIMIHIVMGVASAGISLASGNISLKLAPKGQATSYLATNSVVNSIAAGISPVIGGLLADFFSGRELAWNLSYTTPSRIISLPTLNFQQWDFFFFFAFLLGLYSLHRLVLVKEEGEVEEKIVVHELFAQVRRPIRILSPIEGVRQMVHFPLEVFQNLGKKVKK